MSVRGRISMTALLAFGLVFANVGAAHAHAVSRKGFAHFPGDHSQANGYSVYDMDERCVEIDSYMEHGNGYGRSTIWWTTTENVGQYVHCEYESTLGGNAYDWAAIKMWKTNVFVTVVLKKQGYSGECAARSQYRSQVKTGTWSWSWNSSNIYGYPCNGPGYYYTWSEIQAWDPAIWPQSDGWSPPVHFNSNSHYLPTTAEKSLFP